MKNKIKTLVLLNAIAFLLAAWGCQKCYYCYTAFGLIECHKGTDTLWNSGILGALSYSLKQSGYQCDTIELKYIVVTPINGKPTPVCGKKNYQKNFQEGDSCVFDPDHPF